mmetsp:Transcript_12283/g.30822  ORF Transcript_12283/g.30822 Transcript_12283/m.30822 type:complete len:187 (-) Transcript_12283:11-571(-)
MTLSETAHRLASLALAVSIGWTASHMWMHCSRQTREEDHCDDEMDMEGAFPAIGEEQSHALQYLQAYPDCDVKMVFAVRTDLKMQKGKMCAQVAHAAVDAVQMAMEAEQELLDKWEECGCTKVCLKVDSEEGLLELGAAASEAGLITSIIEDAGRTQVEPGSRTVCGVGPGPAPLIDSVCGHLKLL